MPSARHPLPSHAVDRSRLGELRSALEGLDRAAGL